MKSKLFLILAGSFLCLLFVRNICAEDDFKKDFGSKLGIILKSELRDLTTVVIKAAEDFYNIILKDITLTNEQKELIKGRISSLEEVKAKIKDDASVNLMEGVSYFVKNIVADIVSFERKIAINDESQSEDIQIEIGNFARKEDEAIDVFINNIHAKWIEMFKTISEEEKQKHSEYLQIDNLIERTFKTERIPQTNNNTRNELLRETTRAIINFFDYSAWKNYLSNPTSTD